MSAGGGDAVDELLLLSSDPPRGIIMAAHDDDGDEEDFVIKLRPRPMYLLLADVTQHDSSFFFEQMTCVQKKVRIHYII